MLSETLGTKLQSTILPPAELEIGGTTVNSAEQKPYMWADNI
jgi:hypothetical protein